jgi:hypothetical protein
VNDDHGMPINLNNGKKHLVTFHSGVSSHFRLDLIKEEINELKCNLPESNNATILFDLKFKILK